MIHSLALILIAATWLYVWVSAWRLCRDVGVDERASRLVLASIIPTAGLLLSVHLVATVELFVHRGLVTPESAAMLFIGVACLVRRWAMMVHVRANETNSPPKPGGRLFPFSWTPIAIVALAYLAFTIEALTRFPTGYDALYYHLPVAVRWMQERALNLVVGFNYLSHPENGMIVPFLLAFAGWERMFPLVNLPAAAIVGLTIFGLARSMRFGATASALTACVALGVPMVLFQSVSNYIDLYAAAAWLSALLALSWAARAPGRFERNTLLTAAGLAAGIALGSKTTYLVMVAMLAVVAAAVEWVRPCTDHVEGRRLTRNVLRFGLASLVCSGFWFVRGTVQAGNPVYPLGVKWNDTTILPGLTADDVFPRRTFVDELSRWWNYPWRETKYTGTGYPYGVNNGLGAAYAAFVPLGLLAAVVWAWSALWRGPRDPPERWRLICLLLVASGAVLHFTVFRGMLRFVLPQLLLATAMAGLLINRLLGRFPRSTLSIVVAALSVTAVIAIAKPMQSLAARIKNEVSDRAVFYGVPPSIDELPPGARIVNAADPGYNYPLVGRNLSNVVIDAGLWQTKLSPGALSARTLRRQHVDYVFAVGEPALSSTDPPMIEILADNQDGRRPGMPVSRLYRVQRSAQTASAATTSTRR